MNTLLKFFKLFNFQTASEWGPFLFEGGKQELMVAMS